MANEPVYVTFEFRGNLEEEVEKVTLGVRGLRDESAKTYQRLIADSSTAFNSLSADNRKLAVSIQENINALRDLAVMQKALDDEQSAGSITTQQYVQAKTILTIQEKNLHEAISAGMQALNERIQSEKLAVDSVVQMNKQLQELTATYNNMSKAEREGVVGQSIVKQIQGLQAEVQKANQALREQGEVDNSAADSINRLNKRIQELILSYNDMSKVDREGVAGQNLIKQIQGLQAEIQKANQKLREQEVVDNTAADSIVRLNKRLQELTATYYNMSKADRESTVGQGVLKQIGDLDKQIMTAQTRLSAYSRSAGTGFNSLNMSVQQVARELPSLTMGVNMFFLAISNNVPILVDNVKAARIEYDLLKKSGQAAVPVWKQVLSSIVSWQTALVVGITLLTVYAKDIFNWIQGLFGADQAQKRLNESMTDYNSLLFKSQQELRTLFSALERTKTGTEGHRKAINDINTAYGKYLPNLLSEKSSLNEINSAYLKINSSLKENAALKAQGNAVDKVLEKAIKTQAGALTQMRGIASERLGSTEKSDSIVDIVTNLTEEFRTAGKTWEDTWRSVSFRIMDEVGNTKLGGSFYDELEDYIRSVYKSEKEIADIQKQFNPFFDKKEADRAVIQNKTFWTEIKQQAESVLSSIDAEQKKLLDKGETKGIDPTIVTTYKIAKSEIDQATEALKVYDSYEKQKEAADKNSKSTNKINSVLSQEELARIKQTVELENKVEQAKIDALSESWKKTKAQLQLNHKKELDELDLQQEEYLYKIVEFERKKFEADPKNKGKVFDSSSVRLTEGETSVFNQLRQELFVKQKKEDELFTRDIKREQEDITAHFSSELDKRLVEIDRYYQDEILKAEGYQDVIGQLNSNWNKDRDSAINESFIDEGMKRIALEEDIALKTMDIRKNQYVTESVYNLKRNAEEKKYIQHRLTLLKKSIAQEGTDRYKQIEDEKKQLSGHLTYLDEYGKTLKGEVIQDALSGLSEISGAIGGLNDELGESMQEMQQLIGAVAQLASGNYIGAAVSVITSVVSSIAKHNADIVAYNKNIEAGYWDAVNWKIERQIQLMKELNGINSEQVDQSINEQINELMDTLSGVDLNVKMGNLQAFFDKVGEGIGSANKKGNEFAVNFLKGLFEAFEDDSKAGVDGHWNFRFYDVLKDLSKDEIISLQGIPEIWATLPEEIQNYIKQLSDAVDKQEELKESTKETLTSTTTSNIVDSIIKGFAEGKRSAADFADNFQDMLNNAVLQGVKLKTLEGPLREWYESFAEASGNGLNKDNIKDLKEQYDKIIADAAKELEDMEKITGIGKNPISQQQARAGDFTTMNQDTGSELNGRFASLQLNTSEIKGCVFDMRTMLNRGLEQLEEIANNTSYCKRLERMDKNIEELVRNGLKVK